MMCQVGVYNNKEERLGLKRIFTQFNNSEMRVEVSFEKSNISFSVVKIPSNRCFRTVCCVSGTDQELAADNN